jgi:hypothetical protein
VLSMPRPPAVGTVVVFISHVCLLVEHAEALVSFPPSEIEERFKNIVRRHMESLRASGREIKGMQRVSLSAVQSGSHHLVLNTQLQK